MKYDPNRKVRTVEDEIADIVQQLEISMLKHKLKQCEIIANNVLYFHDKSDYEISLYEILNIIQDKNINESRYDKLSYMEGE